MTEYTVTEYSGRCHKMHGTRAPHSLLQNFYLFKYKSSCHCNL